MLLMSTDCNLFKMQCVGYISGFVVKMLGKIINCEICIKACLHEYGVKDNESLELFDLKQRRPLVKPSKEVILICTTTETAITILLNKINVHDLLKDKSLHERISITVMRKLETFSLFKNLKEHQLNTKSSICISKDHVFTLINSIINCYCKIKFYHCIR